ncbi:hypothetical protein LJB42_002615 [Komagataella kurtzmanii]|nr:hypothetical protein LJB42_002615 [Komagataella kurtzmanii]
MAVTQIFSLPDFNEAITQKGVVVLDFYSPICAPCEVVSPLYEKLSQKYPDAKFYKINGYEEPGSSMQASINVVWWPTFVILVDGQEQWRAKIPNPPQQFPTQELDDSLSKIFS